MGDFLPGYSSPGEIVLATGFSESKIIKEIKGTQIPQRLFAWKSQGRYWIPDLYAKQYIATGYGLPDPLPTPLRGQGLPGYYTPKELAHRLGISVIAVLQKVRGRPERNKPASLLAYEHNRMFWIPETAAEPIIQEYSQRRISP